MFPSMLRRRAGDWHSRGLLIGAMLTALLSARCGEAGQGGGVGGGGGEAPADPALCSPPASVSGAPQTIEDVTALINALVDSHEGKLDLPCFIASLDRPLGATASAGFVSAQPAHGARSPRIFLWSGALVLSVVAEGIGKDLLELGYQTTPTRSIKAEIAFPVTAHLADSAPYDRILDAPGTRCLGCHANEAPVKIAASASAFESDVLRPSDADLVAVGNVAVESKQCDPAAEPERCALLAAIFDEGKLVPKGFSQAAKTLYGE
jgi:hypothetical protein